MRGGVPRAGRSRRHLRGWSVTPLDLADPESGPVQWTAWRYAERMAGTAENAESAAIAIEHFFES